MRYKAIIFDMDGTIIDTEHIWTNSTKIIIERRGIILESNLEKELLKKTAGLSLHRSCQIMKDMAQLPDEVTALIHEQSALACQLYEQYVCFMEGFLLFHHKAQQHNLKVGIATNADDATLHITKRKLNLEALFGKHIYNISHVNNVCKPDPAVYLYAAQQLETDPHDCIAIEDSTHGVNAATAADMFCIGLNSGKNRERINKSDLIVDAYDEIDLHILLAL
jgi:beta-phosphoglucomutase